MISETAATVAVGILGASSVISVATFGGVVRMSMKWGQLERAVNDIGKQLATEREDSDREHAEIYAVLREDRHATNERVTRLENRAWGAGG